MKRVVSQDLVTAGALCYTATLAAWTARYSPAAAAVPAGLLLATVLPGWAVSTALLQRVRVSNVERLVLVPALSMAVLVLGGLGLYAAGVKLDRASWLTLTVSVTLVGSVTGYVRARRRAAVYDSRSAGRPARRLPLVARAAVPLALGAVLLTGAGWLSTRTAVAQSSTPVTALSAVVASTDKAGGRTVALDLTSGEGKRTTFQVRLTGPNGYRSEVDLALTRGGHWTRTVAVPAGTVTVELFRAGDTSAYRSVFLEESA